MIQTLRKFRGGQTKQVWGGASLETFSGESQLKKSPCIYSSWISNFTHILLLWIGEPSSQYFLSYNLRTFGNCNFSETFYCKTCWDLFWWPTFFTRMPFIPQSTFLLLRCITSLLMHTQLTIIVMCNTMEFDNRQNKVLFFFGIVIDWWRISNPKYHKVWMFLNSYALWPRSFCSDPWS